MRGDAAWLLPEDRADCDLLNTFGIEERCNAVSHTVKRLRVGMAEGALQVHERFPQSSTTAAVFVLSLFVQDVFILWRGQLIEQGHQLGVNRYLSPCGGGFAFDDPYRSCGE